MEFVSMVDKYIARIDCLRRKREGAILQATSADWIIYSAAQARQQVEVVAGQFELFLL